MQITPPRCPNRDCSQHTSPAPRFYVRHGYYRPRCRRTPVPRFQCRTCHRTFSSQTFRHDYRDRRPECNVRLFEMLVSGSGLRQAAPDRLLERDLPRRQGPATGLSQSPSKRSVAAVKSQ